MFVERGIKRILAQPLPVIFKIFPVAWPTKQPIKHNRYIAYFETRAKRIDRSMPHHSIADLKPQHTND